MNRKQKTILLVLSLMMTLTYLNAQVQDSISAKSTPYDLLSTYYKSDFKPFKKNNWYVGLAFSLDDKKSTNSEGLVQTIVDGDNLDYNLLFKGGYFYSDYGMVGLDFSYYQNKFTGLLFQDPDTVQSNSITRGYAFTPNMRASIPLIPSERLSFFVGLGVNFGLETTNTRNTKYVDEITKSYITVYNFGLNITPGITFFAMENFAVELGLNIFGYNVSISDTKNDGSDLGRVVKQKLDLSINLLTIELGLSYYFGAKNN